MSEYFKTRNGQKPVRLASTSGHVVIVGSEWQEVLDPMVPDALKHGLLSKELYDAALAEVRDGIPLDVKPPATPAPVPPVPEAPEAPPTDTAAEDAAKAAAAAERHKTVLLAVKSVLDLKEQGESLTPGGKTLVSVLNGVPKVDAVSEFAGFKVSGAEIEEALR
ncbi:MAG TPA: hypothetical protein DCZ63_14880 [Geobacter sp.]|nr:hypothetical protein [Geobacter sp.]